MASQNLFEKYGIRDVADVTLYRIEKKEETFESQRKIAASSILKGALELRTVYPMINGVGDEEGFDALVFTEATINKGTNYDCDDVVKLDTKIKVIYKESAASKPNDNEILKNGAINYIKTNFEAIFKNAFSADKGKEVEEASKGFVVELGLAKEQETGIVYSAEKIKAALASDNTTVAAAGDINVEVVEPLETEEVITDEETTVYNSEGTFLVTAVVDLKNEDEKATGVYENENSATPDQNLEIGTHEYTYPEQICMLFARRQNIIAKTGVRYVFENADEIFGDVAFNDNFAAAPKSAEKVVVAGLVGKFDESTYDLEEVNGVIAQLRDTLEAKAYDVTYNDYAELVVEDEMGYFNPKFLGKDYVRKQGVGSITFFGANGYKEYVGDNVDVAIKDAEMWSDGVHYSINDAIDALRQKKLVLDTSETNGAVGIESIFGGYKVGSKEDPKAGTEDTVNADNIYNYKVDKTGALVAATNKDGEEVTSKYPLENVVTAVSEIGRAGVAFGKALRVDTAGKTSNRAIYVKVDGSVDTAAGAYIYLLRNKNFKKLSLDKEGIFKFVDKAGNVLYYQDKIFKGIEYLALVVLGDKGLIFVVNRHGTQNIERVAWMVNDKGYVTNSQAKLLVENGLIHTTDITVNDESFEATCTVGKMKIHETKKMTNRYTPVLFLDTLKVSTLEQTASSSYATGSRGNANLIGWDYGKEITLSIDDALFTPASMSAIFGAGENGDIRKGVKEAKTIDRLEKVTAKRNFIVPAGNSKGTPSEADKTAQAVFIDPNTMEPYADGTPIAEGEKFLKFTRSIAYEGQSIGNVIEISAEKFPGTYKVVGDTYIRNKETGEDQRFQFIIPQAKMGSEQTITLEADGDPTVFSFNMTVLRPDDGKMVRLVSYDVIENEEENDGSTMVKGTENLNLLDDAELFKISDNSEEDESFIGATEF